jgi:hypothetical protein
MIRGCKDVRDPRQPARPGMKELRQKQDEATQGVFVSWPTVPICGIPSRPVVNGH